MTIVRTGFIAALGLLVVGSLSPANATPTVAVGEVDATSLYQLVKDRGSWIEPKHSRRGYHFDDRRRFDDHHHHKRYSKKKKRKAYKRGYYRGYDRGYEEGYYDARKRAFYKRHRHHHRHYYPRGGFRGGIYFGDGRFGRGDFRFRY